MRDKEEFARAGDGERVRFYWLAVFNWLVPITIVLIGLVVTTQRFADSMNYDPNVVGNPLFTLKSGYRIYNPLVFLMGMFKFAFNNVYSYYFFQAAPPAFLAITIGFLLFIATRIFIGARQRNQHIHGTARWAEKKDLEAFGMLQRYGVVCGELSSAGVGYRIDAEKASLTLNLKKNLITRKAKTAPLVCHSGRTNTWMIAPTRSGKGVSTVIPTCLNYGVPYYAKDKLGRTIVDKKTGKKVTKGRGSMVIFDPKGENWEASAGYRSQWSVCIPFRPMDAEGNTAHYNPIHEIPDSPSEAFSWADMVGEIFFGADKAKSGGGDGATEYFNNKARDIFSGVVLHVRFSKKIEWKDKNLTTVLKIFSQTSEEDGDDGDDEDGGGGCGEAMLAQMAEEDIHVHDDGSLFPEIHTLIVEAAGRSKIQHPKERSSTYSTVFSKISLFQDPLIQQATAYSDFSVDDFVDCKVGISLYLIVPYNHIKRISPVFRMLITFMIKKFSSGTTNANAVKLKIPCLFLLDEFPVLGYFPDIALNAGILAGYGVTFFIVSQSLNQIVDVYGENHPFLDHCKTIILYAPGNLKDAKSFADTIGSRSVLLDNISASGGKYEAGFSSMSRSSQETRTSLIEPDELMKLEFNRAIIFNQGAPPYKGKKVVYYEDPRFNKKAFREAPEMEKIYGLLNRLPSRIKMRKIAAERDKQRESAAEIRIEKIKQTKIEILDMIPSDFDIFGESV